ncbi:integrase arm-type DNA-binding domain-containing protein [Acinetobacter ursingii]|uniref:integrase arm-type DNA-binding domain-containing protein n=1 Tax=Acinetobacter ursingii TaxID=108980 RepID=UPI001A51EA5E|nr:integrase arm-type DNA-binding domain-containing protein [Acinetobacter ursingii]VTX59160.1 Prophage integrase IntA [Acinetobacter ursingii]
MRRTYFTEKLIPQKYQKVVVPLTDTKIKKTKADPDNIQKLSDGKGLFLMIAKNGEKFWRFDYARPYSKKRNSISFGNYPIVGLAEARQRRNEACSLLAQNIDPQVEKLRV